MIVVHHGMLLMVKHDDLFAGREYWCLPGGRIEPGETPEQAAVREVKEETGLHVKVIRHLLTDRFNVDSGYTTAFTFLGEVVSGQLSLGEDPEDVDWGIKQLKAAAWRPIDFRLIRNLKQTFGL